MEKKEIKGSCVLCDYQFSIPISELQDYMTYPFCGNEADIEVKCPRCGGEISAGSPDLDRRELYMEGNREYLWDRVKTTCGVPMAALRKTKIAAHDILSLLFLMLVILFMLVQ